MPPSALSDLPIHLIGFLGQIQHDVLLTISLPGHTGRLFTSSFLVVGVLAPCARVLTMGMRADVEPSGLSVWKLSRFCLLRLVHLKEEL